SRIVWSNCRQSSGLAIFDNNAAGRQRLIDLAENDWQDIEPTPIPGSDDILVISDRSGGTQVWRVDRTHQRPPAVLAAGKDASTLAVSTDGKQFAFGDDGGYWIAPLDGSGPARKLVDARSDHPPSFRRDGRALYFEGVDEEKRPRIGEVPIA